MASCANPRNISQTSTHGVFVARAKRVTQRIFGTVHAVDVPPRGDAAKAISLQIRRHENGRVREEWLSVAKPLKARVRELATVPESLLSQTFDLVIDEAAWSPRCAESRPRLWPRCLNHDPAILCTLCQFRDCPHSRVDNLAEW